MSIESPRHAATVRSDEPITHLTQSRSCEAHRTLLERFWRPVGIYTECVVCGREFWPLSHPRQNKARKYCSHACHLRHRRETERDRRESGRSAA